jgi:hypothetical protein
VPIGVGAKIVGRQSDYNIGVLDVETRDLPDASLRRQNLFAARVSRNVFEQSWVGAIVTNGNPEASVSSSSNSNPSTSPTSGIASRTGADRNDIALREGRFYTQVVTARADYNFTPNVSWQNLEQYDNESGFLSFQSRFRWILRPGNDLFLVVNRGWVKTFDDRFQSTFDRTSSKLQYTFRF